MREAVESRATIHEDRLPNGVRLVVEENPVARTAAVGWFVRTGARDEPAALEGVSHFLEHMCFKGTARRDALAIGRALDEMGARANAWTSWEETAYYVQVLPEKVPQGIDLLTDMMRPALRKEDFDLEKKVILEEIALYEDRPDYLLFDHALAHRFAGHPLGRRILGTAKTIGPLTPEAMRAYHAERYRAGGLVFVAAGAVAFDAVRREVETATAVWNAEEAAPRETPAPPAPPGGKHVPREKDHEVRRVVLFDGPDAADEAACDAAAVAALALGGSTGSRMYWKVVHPGLAEEASVFHEPFDGCGLFAAVMVTQRASYEKAREAFDRVLREAVEKPLADDEIARAKRKTTTRILLAAESPLSRFRSLGDAVLHGLPPRTAREAAERIRRLDHEAVREQTRAFAGAATEVLFR